MLNLHRRTAIALFFMVGLIGPHSLFGRSLAPKPEQKPCELVAHGQVRIDPYYWLRERENPKVIDYLTSENRFAEENLAPAKPMSDTLFKEFKGRLPNVADSAPHRYKGYDYYTRTFADLDYSVYLRRKISGTEPKTPVSQVESPEEVLLDVNELAKGYAYFDLGSIKVSNDDRFIAYTYDPVGRRNYVLKVIDRLSRQTILTLEKTAGSFEWAGNGLYFTKQDEETLREYQVYYQSLQDTRASLVYEEADTTFNLSLSKSLTENYIFIHSASTLADEWRYLEIGDQKREFKIFKPRERGLEYRIADGEDRFYVLTNLRAKNFQVMEVLKRDLENGSAGVAVWKTVLESREGVFRSELLVLKDAMVVKEKAGGQDILRVISRRDSVGGEHTIPFNEPVYVADLYSNWEYTATTVNYTYESMATPPSVYSYQLTKGSSQLIKQDEVVGYRPEQYQTERVWVDARDGAKVPVSLVYRKGLQRNGQNPTLIYGYGSYGVTIDPTFNANRISLLDRGFVYAIAHVRGGGMLGRPWYEGGKLLTKQNTFNDFVDASRYLIDQKWADPARLYAMGGSAGGLLMGAVINQAPELYRGVVAQVPFVDVVTTMLDESIPLTTGEYDEWGDPRQKVYYDYMMGYSPYDNVKGVSYPNILVTTGLYDSQVQYWEPAKWVAKLRDFNQSESLILLKTNMAAGHGGASGNLEGMRETAEEWSFILMLNR